MQIDFETDQVKFDNLANEKLLANFSFVCTFLFALCGFVFIPILLFGNFILSMVIVCVSLFSSSLAFLSAQRHKLEVQRIKQAQTEQASS